MQETDLFNMIKREKDVVFGNRDLKDLYVMKHFPVYMGVTDESREKDLFSDEIWTISEGSGMVQLRELVPVEILYAKSHNSAIGKVWKKHHECFADFLNNNKGETGILEIGGGNGILNKIYNEKYEYANWSTIEPSEVDKLPNCNAEYIKAFWNEQFDFGLINLEYDTLVHTHLMEHQFDLQEFFNMCRKSIKEGNKMIFSVPNLNICMERYYPYALNFEHTILLTEEIIDLFLEMNDFEIVAKNYFEDHSIFYSTKKILSNEEGKNRNYSKEIKKIYKTSKVMFENYIKYYEDIVDRINSIIEKTEKTVYIFGAHINTQLLINFGLNTKKIKAILDNDKLKQGKRLYGTGLYVKSPVVLEKEENPVVILLMGAYTGEIKEDIVEKINATTEFIVS